MPEFSTGFNGLMITFNYPEVGKTSGEILDLIQKDNEITTPALSGLLEITERSVERNLQKLQKHKIVRIGGTHRPASARFS